MTRSKYPDRQGALFVEKHLAQAHRSLWKAAMEAENWRLQTVSDDLWQLVEELRRVHEAVVRLQSRQ